MIVNNFFLFFFQIYRNDVDGFIGDIKILWHTYVGMVGSSGSLEQMYSWTYFQYTFDETQTVFDCSMLNTRARIGIGANWQHDEWLCSIFICVWDVEYLKQPDCKTEPKMMITFRLTILSRSHYSNDECICDSQAWICQTNKQIIRRMLNDFLWFDEQRHKTAL